MLSLDGSKIVIPGGSSGIGLATAELAIASGAQVTIAGRNKDRLQAARSVLGDVSTRVCDVSDPASVFELFESVGECDHVLICAAETRHGALLDTRVDDYAVDMNSRYWGHYHICKHGAGYVREGGSITFVSGLAAHTHFPGSSARAASQAAIEQLASYLACELAPIRINTLVPGVVDTPALRDFFGDAYEEGIASMARRIPVGRIAQPEEVAELALFVMRCAYMTGSTVLMDGGQLAGLPSRLRSPV